MQKKIKTHMATSNVSALEINNYNHKPQNSCRCILTRWILRRVCFGSRQRTCRACVHIVWTRDPIFLDAPHTFPVPSENTCKHKKETLYYYHGCVPQKLRQCSAFMKNKQWNQVPKNVCHTADFRNYVPLKLHGSYTLVYGAKIFVKDFTVLYLYI